MKPKPMLRDMREQLCIVAFLRAKRIQKGEEPSGVPGQRHPDPPGKGENIEK